MNNNEKVWSILLLLFFVDMIKPAINIFVGNKTISNLIRFIDEKFIAKKKKTNYVIRCD